MDYNQKIADFCQSNGLNQYSVELSQSWEKYGGSIKQPNRSFPCFLYLFWLNKIPNKPPKIRFFYDFFKSQYPKGISKILQEIIAITKWTPIEGEVSKYYNLCIDWHEENKIRYLKELEGQINQINFKNNAYKFYFMIVIANLRGNCDFELKQLRRTLQLNNKEIKKMFQMKQINQYLTETQNKRFIFST